MKENGVLPSLCQQLICVWPSPVLPIQHLWGEQKHVLLVSQLIAKWSMYNSLKCCKLYHFVPDDAEGTQRGQHPCHRCR